MVSAAEYLDLLDYRRQVFTLYAQVRQEYGRDRAAAHALWRRRRDELFGRHPQSALSATQRAAFTGLRYFPYNPDLAFAATLETVPPDEAHLPASTGAPPPLLRAGVVRLPVGALEVYWLNTYGGGLFLPFRDASSGTETYGGGRYLLDTVKGADLGSAAGGALIVDFNFAYHPSCHYDPQWSCPLSPAANALATRIDAGEMAYAERRPG